MRWLILFVSKICGGGLGGYGAGGRGTLSVDTGGATPGGDGISFSSTLVYTGVVYSGGNLGYSGTLGAAFLMGVGGLGCSVCSAIGLLVHCSVGGYGSCYFGAVLVLNVAANFSIEVEALGPCSRKGVASPVF